jgi:hypothetical protein
LGYAEFSTEIQTPEKPGLTETDRSSGAARTIQNEALVEIRGLCCFWDSNTLRSNREHVYKVSTLYFLLSGTCEPDRGERHAAQGEKSIEGVGR